MIHLHRVLGKYARIAHRQLWRSGDSNSLKLAAVGRTDPTRASTSLAKLGHYPTRLPLEWYLPAVHTDVGGSSAWLDHGETLPHAISQLRVIGEASSAIAITTKRLGREKASGTDRAQPQLRRPCCSLPKLWRRPQLPASHGDRQSHYRRGNQLVAHMLINNR